MNRTAKSATDLKTAAGKNPGGHTPKEITYCLPALPSILTRPLGLEGWTKLEPVILAALITEEPLLLVGPHGSAKSFMLERLSHALGLTYRFYNASLINYDDLVGIPMPDEQRNSLRYIYTPTAIWDAEIVFVDEINRTRPELQNKLFPIVHEKRVQGTDLKNLRYRWAAMNPPPADRNIDENEDIYFGAEPLDPALADRFSFILQVPGWQQLTQAEKLSILRDQFDGSHPFPVSPKELIELGKSHYQRLRAGHPKSIEEYVVLLLSRLEAHKLILSSRRATMLHRNILAVHAARIALYNVAFHEVPYQVIDWNGSALLALFNSIPEIAEGRRIDSGALLAEHKHTWEVVKIDESNPWRKLLAVQDPVERCVLGIQMRDDVSDDDLSKLILDALSAQFDYDERTILALAIYLALHKERALRATVYETLAAYVEWVVTPRGGCATPKDKEERRRLLAAKRYADKLWSEQCDGHCQCKQYAANLLLSLDHVCTSELTPRQIYKRFANLLHKLQVRNGGSKQ